MNTTHNQEFETINQGFNSIFKPNKLSIGLLMPLENYNYDTVPSMQYHIKRAKLAEELGFKALWLRDIPFNVPSFGDAGQLHDPFVYLSFLAAHTNSIALGVSSIILPLRHPAHVAKAAASIDSLSEGRLVLGVASGDRPEEYPALNMTFPNRGERFRDSFEYIRKMWEDNPIFENSYGNVTSGLNMLPKPANKKFPMLITGASQQNADWLASNAEGIITYPRNPATQVKLINDYRNRLKDKKIENKPVAQSLYIDLVDDETIRPQPIHLGYRLNVKQLKEHLKLLESIGVNHVALNLRFNQADIESTLKKLSQEILPYFL